jgi:4-amino-4-deoxy-L-arabinose transferase-like glycosyltransferase
MSETLATLAVALALLLTYRFIRRPTLGAAVATGLTCGLAAMARQELLLLLPLTVVPVIFLAHSLERRRRFALAGAATLATIVVAGPWVLWNLARFDEPVTFSTNDGITICGANHPRTWYGSGTGLWALNCAVYETPEGDRSLVSRALRDRGLEYASSHLERLPVVVVARIARVWSLYAPGQMATYNTGEGREEWVSWFAFASWWLLVPFAVFGVVDLRRHRVHLWPLLSQFVIVTITAAAIYGLLRFRIPADVSVVVLSAAGIDSILTRCTAPSTPSVGTEPTRRLAPRPSTEATR